MLFYHCLPCCNSSVLSLPNLSKYSSLKTNTPSVRYSLKNYVVGVEISGKNNCQKCILNKILILLAPVPVLNHPFIFNIFLADPHLHPSNNLRPGVCIIYGHISCKLNFCILINHLIVLFTPLIIYSSLGNLKTTNLLKFKMVVITVGICRDQQNRNFSKYTHVYYTKRRISISIIVVLDAYK